MNNGTGVWDSEWEGGRVRRVRRVGGRKAGKERVLLHKCVSC